MKYIQSIIHWNYPPMPKTMLIDVEYKTEHSYKYKFVSPWLYMHVMAGFPANKCVHKTHPLHNTTNKIQYFKTHCILITSSLAWLLHFKTSKYMKFKNAYTTSTIYTQ